MPRITDGLRGFSRTQASALKLVLSSRSIAPAAWTPVAIRQAIRDWSTGKTTAQQLLLLLDLILAMMPFDED